MLRGRAGRCRGRVTSPQHSRGPLQPSASRGPGRGRARPAVRGGRTAVHRAAGNPFRTKPRSPSPQGEGRPCPPAWPGREHRPGRRASSPGGRTRTHFPLMEGEGVGGPRAGASLGAAPAQGGHLGRGPWRGPCRAGARATGFLSRRLGGVSWVKSSRVPSPLRLSPLGLSFSQQRWREPVGREVGPGPVPAGHPAGGRPRASGLPSSLPSDVCPLRICCRSHSAPPAGPVTGSG